MEVREEERGIVWRRGKRRRKGDEGRNHKSRGEEMKREKGKTGEEGKAMKEERRRGGEERNSWSEEEKNGKGKETREGIT